MRFLFIVILFSLLSCHSLTEQERKVKDLTGNWLILYPREGVSSSASHRLYAQLEDSIGALSSLKLVSFTKDRRFVQQDSIHKPGKWELTESGELFITDAGKGFDRFRCVFYGYDKDKKTLQLKEKVAVGDEMVSVVWHLKKIGDDNDASRLFEESENKWRIPAREIESDTEIKNRLVAMLRYYSAYYKLVQSETNYFIPQRVMMPFKFYQRGMGLPKFDTTGVFTSFFYSIRQAKLAHRWLDRTMTSLGNSYPSADNYVEGYSLFMEMMADEIGGKKQELEEEKGIFKQ
jgi:hypothetical protein